MNTSALFSDCKNYRYILSRRWEQDKPSLLFCMLNPSTADEINDDPTITRCTQRAKLLGFGAITVVNLFAFRSTDPKALYKAEDPIGPDNTNIILKLAAESKLVICGWGKHGDLRARGWWLLAKFRHCGIRPHVLKLNKDGSPAHPLYIGYDVKPFDMDTGKVFNGLEEQNVPNMP